MMKCSSIWDSLLNYALENASPSKGILDYIFQEWDYLFQDLYAFLDDVLEENPTGIHVPEKIGYNLQGPFTLKSVLPPQYRVWSDKIISSSPEFTQRLSLPSPSARLEPAQKKTKHECVHCGKTFIKKSYASLHTSKCKGPANDQVPYPKHSCFFCGKDFSTFSCFQSHVDQCPKRSASDKGFVCIKCKNYVILNEENREVEKHDCVAFYACLKCDYMSYVRGPYREHYLKEHLGIAPKVFCCETCGKTINHKGDLEKHKITHTKERPFTCLICSKSFSRKSILSIHLTTHTNETIPCEICGKIFGNKKKVIEHKRSQHPEDGVHVRHPCTHCESSFRNKYYLSRHIKIKHSRYLLI